MNRQLFGLTLLISIIITDQTVGPPAFNFTREDYDQAFFDADKEIKETGQLEKVIVSKGGTISKDIASPEARHQGSGGDYLSKALNAIDELFTEASKALIRNKQIPKERRDELQFSNVYYLGGPRSQKAYEMCMKLQEVTPCDQTSPYRRADGSCNNIYIPTWGRANSCTSRYLSASYDDDVSDPRKSVTGGSLPNARYLSTSVHDDIFRNTDRRSLMLTQWGKFLDHDMALSPMIRTAETMDIINCCAEVSKSHPACMEIEIPKTDTFYPPLGKYCLNLVRSLGCTPYCRLGPKDMVNFPTSFVHASNLYGSSQTDQNNVRLMTGGLLKSQYIDGLEYLPYMSLSQNHQCTIQKAPHQCFKSGDERVNEQPGLTSMHTIWLRQHNYLARQLRRLNPRLSDEHIFQKIRRIIGAMMQHITYNEFLPTLLGEQFTRRLGLSSITAGRTTYQPYIDPTIMTDFSTAAFRFGHSMIQNQLPELNPYRNISLKDNYFNEEVVTTGQVSSLLLGSCEGPAQKFDRYIVKAVTDHLFQVTGTPFGLDLAAINIQRGRDHGLRSYIDYLMRCSDYTVKITSFQDLKNIVTRDCLKKLKQVYANVRDIDLFVGGLCEKKVTGILGPTFRCIIAYQFQNLKYGDRFYYEHGTENGAITFTNAQLKEIRKVTSAVVCNQCKLPKIKTSKNKQDGLPKR